MVDYNFYEIIKNSSKGVILDGPLGSKQDISPYSNLSVILRMVRKDPILKAAVISIVDEVIKNGYDFTSTNNQQMVRDNKKLEDLRFWRLLRKIIFNLVIYSNAFIEIVGNAQELHVLETTQMEITADEHGDILAYKQNAFTTQSPSEQGKIIFSPEDVVHLKVSDITTAVWSEIDLDSLALAVDTKSRINQFINYLFRTNQFRNMYSIKSGTNAQQRQNFLQYLKQSENDLTKPIIAEGEIEQKVMRDFSDGMTFIEMLKRYDNEILMLLQVPPIVVGLPDNTNRSSSDGQYKAFYDRVKAIQKVIEDELNSTFFKKIGMPTLKIKFRPIDKRSEKDDLEIAERLFNMNMKPEQLEKFLRNTGLELPEGELFNAKDDIMVDSMGNGKSEDLYPSRQRKAENEASQRKGTGDSASQNSKQKQEIVRNSIADKYKDNMRYW